MTPWLAEPPGWVRRLGLELPTGTGKTIAAAAAATECQPAIYVSNVTAVHTAALALAGYTATEGLTDDQYRQVALDHGIMTPAIFQREAEAGRLDHVKLVIADEAHHWRPGSQAVETFERYPEPRGARLLGFTATWFCMNPRDTFELREWWQNIVRLMSVKEATEQGYWLMPQVRMSPLLDDDLVQLGAGGEFRLSALANSTGSRLADLAELTLAWSKERPTAVLVPSVELAVELARMVGGESITASSSRAERAACYARLARQKTILTAVGVVGEGWDCPELGCLIDAKPTMSPVAWLQMFGRLSRPWPTQSPWVGQDKFYVCTNRNLERHAYLLAGSVPDDSIREAQEAFESRPRRSARRGRQLEGIGRFAANIVKLACGLDAEMYHLSVMRQDGDVSRLQEVVLLFDPRKEAPVCISRQSTQTEAGSFRWAKWQRSDPPVELTGFTSARLRGRDLTPNQLKWWQKSARHFGLDDSVLPESQSGFTLLPALVESKTWL